MSSHNIMSLAVNKWKVHSWLLLLVFAKTWKSAFYDVTKVKTMWLRIFFSNQKWPKCIVCNNRVAAEGKINYRSSCHTTNDLLKLTCSLCIMSLTWCYNCILLAAGVLWRHWGAGQAFHSFKMRRVLFFTLCVPAFMQLYPLNLTLLSVTILLCLFAPFPTTWDRDTFGWWGIANDKNTVRREEVISVWCTSSRFCAIFTAGTWSGDPPPPLWLVQVVQ